MDAGSSDTGSVAGTGPLNVLVLGGTQFMGRLMVDHLLASGHRVTLSNRGVTANPFGERLCRTQRAAWRLPCRSASIDAAPRSFANELVPARSGRSGASPTDTFPVPSHILALT